MVRVVIALAATKGRLKPVTPDPDKTLAGAADDFAAIGKALGPDGTLLLCHVRRIAPWPGREQPRQRDFRRESSHAGRRHARLAAEPAQAKLRRRSSPAAPTT
jgi:hypothetical protein